MSHGHQCQIVVNIDQLVLPDSHQYPSARQFPDNFRRSRWCGSGVPVAWVWGSGGLGLGSWWPGSGALVAWVWGSDGLSLGHLWPGSKAQVALVRGSGGLGILDFYYTFQ